MQIRSAPDPEWIYGHYEHVRALQASEQDSRLDRRIEHQRLVAEQGATDTRAVAAANGDVSAAKAIAKSARLTVKSREKRQRKAARKKAGGGAVSAAAAVPKDTSTAIVPFEAPKGQAAASQASIEKRVAAEHPAINGRKACAFFFGPAKSCIFDAPGKVCGNGHHGV